MDPGGTLTCGSLSNREALFASGAVKSLDSGVSEAGTEFFFKNFFVYLWLFWVFIAVYGLSLVNGEWGLLFIAVAGSFLTTGPSGKTRN